MKTKATLNLTVTKDNYVEYLCAWPNASETFAKNLKKFCNVSPEFTHEPRMRVVIIKDVYEIEEEHLLYRSNYSYGKFVALLKCDFFCLNVKKISEYEALTFDLKSFNIKRASQGKIDRMCGTLPPWYDPNNEMSFETRELIDGYLRLRKELGVK